MLTGTRWIPSYLRMTEVDSLSACGCIGIEDGPQFPGRCEEINLPASLSMHKVNAHQIWTFS